MKGNTVPFSSKLWSALKFREEENNAVQHCAVQCWEVKYSTVQWNTVQCSILSTGQWLPAVPGWSQDPAEHLPASQGAAGAGGHLWNFCHLWTVSLDSFFTPVLLYFCHPALVSTCMCVLLYILPLYLFPRVVVSPSTCVLEYLFQTLHPCRSSLRTPVLPRHTLHPCR